MGTGKDVIFSAYLRIFPLSRLYQYTSRSLPPPPISILITLPRTNVHFFLLCFYFPREPSEAPHPRPPRELDNVRSPVHSRMVVSRASELGRGGQRPRRGTLAGLGRRLATPSGATERRETSSPMGPPGVGGRPARDPGLHLPVGPGTPARSPASGPRR